MTFFICGCYLLEGAIMLASGQTCFCCCDTQLGVVTSRHVTKVSVTSFDPPQPKTPCCTRTSRLYVSWNGSYCRSKFYIAEIRIFDLFGSCDLDLDQMTFMYELDPYFLDDLEIYRMCENERPSFYVWAFESYCIIRTQRQKDKTDD